MTYRSCAHRAASDVSFINISKGTQMTPPNQIRGIMFATKLHQRSVSLSSSHTLSHSYRFGPLLSSCTTSFAALRDTTALTGLFDVAQEEIFTIEGVNRRWGDGGCGGGK